MIGFIIGIILGGLVGMIMCAILSANGRDDEQPVVRCQECKWWSRHVGFFDSPNGHCFCHDLDLNQYDFCSYGERKEDEE